MWQGLQNGRTYPRVISREIYCQARNEYNNKTNIDFDDFMIGWIGWMGEFIMVVFLMVVIVENQVEEIMLMNK